MKQIFQIQVSVKKGCDIVECRVHSHDMNYDETMACMIKVRDHLTARIAAAPLECPAAKNSASASAGWSLDI